MNYQEILEKIQNSSLYRVIETKEIQHGKSIRLSNGGIINCYNSGTFTIQGKEQAAVKELLGLISSTENKKIFVVYGHDDMAKTQLEALLRRWDLDPIILDQRASGGQTIIEKLEEYGADVGYAIVLATPDDVGKSKSETDYRSRVRQNVVLELGMFLAKLGRQRVAILLKEDPQFDKPSDIQGLIYIPFEKRVDEVALSLIRELSEQGYKIDPSKI